MTRRGRGRELFGRFVASLSVLALAPALLSASLGGLRGRQAGQGQVGYFPKKAWTVAVYLAADNDLFDASFFNFDEMEQALTQTNDLNIVVLWDGWKGASPPQGWNQRDFTAIYWVQPDGNVGVPANYVQDQNFWYVPPNWQFAYVNGQPIGAPSPTEENTGNRTTLTQFLNWVFQNFPSDHYALILWNHGWGWAPRSRGPDGLLLRPPARTSPSRGEVRPVRGVCVDETSNNDLLTVREAANAIASTTRGFVDVLGFDACVMQMLEVAYEVKDVAQYMVGSEETIWGGGWAYHTTLSQVSSATTPLDLAKILASPAQLNISWGGIQGGLDTVSALDLSKVGTLASDVSALGEQLRSLLRYDRRYQEALHSQLHSLCFETAVTQAGQYLRAAYLDLLDLCRWVQRLVMDSRARNLARKIENVLGKAVVAKANSAKFQDAGGLSIYFPTSHDLLWEEAFWQLAGMPFSSQNYSAQNLSFCADLGWDEFLNSFLSTSYPDPYEPNDYPEEAFDLGTLLPDREYDLPEASLDDGTEDWFKFSLSADRSQVEISVWCTGRRANTVAYLYKSLKDAEEGNYLAMDDDGLMRDLGRAQYGSHLKIVLRAGTYYLKVASSAKGRGQGYAVQIKVGTGQILSVVSVPGRLLASIVSPSEGERLTGKVDILGTAYSPELEGWRLEFGSGSYPALWSPIAAGDRPVHRSKLATWDTSKLPDGTYTLRLTVRDREGREAEARVTVLLDNTFPSIVGTVTDAETGEPIEGAVVEALGPEGFRATAYTDALGNYAIRNLKPTKYTVRAQALGHEEAEQSVEVTMEKEEWRADFALRKAPPRRPGSISGLVYVSVSREPLGNAEVTVSFGGKVVATATTSGSALIQAGYKFNYRIEGLEPARYEVKVSLPGFTPQPESQVVEVREGEETRGVDFSMRPLHYLGRGLRMVSVPYDYSRVAPDPADLLRVPPASLKLARWETARNRYAFYPDPPADKFRLGEGYWLYLDNPVSITVEGIAASSAQPYPILLRAGWNMIGAPFTFPVDWFACEVIADGQRMSVEEATRRGILGSGIWTYEFGTYRLAFTLEPWKGYWVRAFKNCTLLVSNTLLSGRARREAAWPALLPAGRGGWWLTISVEACGKADRGNVLGVLDGAGAGYDPGLDVLEPPPVVGLRPQVRAYFEPPSGPPLAFDLKGGQRAEWTLVVEIPPGADEVKVTWEGLKAVPKDVTLLLEDAVAGRAVFMRAVGSYTFRPRRGESVRRLRIRALKGGPALRVAALGAERLRGGGVLVRFLLTAPAQVDVRLLAPSGRVLAEGGRAFIPAGWGRALLRGASFPPGLYLVEVTAKGEEGRRARAVRPLLLR